MDLETIQNALRSHRLEVVAAETGLSYPTVRRYVDGKVTQPPLDTMQRLSDWLEAHETGEAEEAAGAGSR